jgi:hypothetical protein
MMAALSFAAAVSPTAAMMANQHLKMEPIHRKEHIYHQEAKNTLSKTYHKRRYRYGILK